MQLRQGRAIVGWMMLAFARLAVAQAEPGRDPGFVGAWRGELAVAGEAVPVAMRVFESGKGHRARLVVGAAAIPGSVLKAEVVGSKLSLDLGDQGSYVGDYDKKRKTLIGQWRQRKSAGPALPLAFRRAPELGDEEYPQQPPGPYPYDVVEVVLPSSDPGRSLYGTLTRPKTPGPHPAVVLHTAFGGFDRDEPMGDRLPFFVLADVLTRRGMVVVRYDKLGTGKSPGTFVGVSPARYAADLRAVASWTRSRPEVDPARVGYLGHSEGAMVVILAAGDDPRPAFVVSIAPPLQSGEKQAVDMLSAVGDMVGAPGFLKLLQGVFISRIAAILREEPDDKLATARMSFVPEAFRAQLASPWARFYLQHDGRASAARVACLAYVVFMKNDPLVPEKPNSAVANEGFAGPNRARVRIEIRGDLDHFLMPHEPPDPGILPVVWTVAPAFLNDLVDWIAPAAGLPATAAAATDSRPK